MTISLSQHTIPTLDPPAVEAWSCAGRRYDACESCECFDSRSVELVGNSRSAWCTRIDCACHDDDAVSAQVEDWRSDCMVPA